MTALPLTQNTLFYGDNLHILREYIPTQSVDLIYLDPPFNSNRSYNVLFKDASGKEAAAQITAFADTWHWDTAAAFAYHDLVQNAVPVVVKMIGALHDFIGENQVLAYLVMMTTRLIELQRVLKSTGTLYLHCDPTASHYLKIILDTLFGIENFRNEIVWQRTRAAKKQSQLFGKTHDIIFVYTKSAKFTFNQQFLPYQAAYLQSHYRYTDEATGRRYTLDNFSQQGQGPARRFGDKVLAPPENKHWIWSQERIDAAMDKELIVFSKNGIPRMKRYLDEVHGEYLQDIWIDISEINSQAAERLGYPTQKPQGLLERIILSSSNPGDWVLDPFCGCGTTIAAAQKLERQWIGIDITHLAIALQKYRLTDAFAITTKDYQVIGEPRDLAAALQLATDDRFQFQWWALSLIKAKPIGGDGDRRGKKGKDRGIDGIINFIDDAKSQPKSVLVQVKSGKVKSGDIRDLRGTIERENAVMGVFITLEPPSKEMEKEALAAGYYTSELWQRSYPKIQILTIAQLLSGAEVAMPSAHNTFKKAPKVPNGNGTQSELEM